MHTLDGKRDTRWGWQSWVATWLVGETPAHTVAGKKKFSGLAVDLLLEIVARTDVTTVVRSAATCRLFRRPILEPASRSRLALQLAADDGTGFDPALLIGVSYQEYEKKVTSYRIVHTPAPNQLRARVDAGSLRDSFRPVASRDRLLLFRRYRFPPEHHPSHIDLRVCDVLTGHVTDLPPPYLPVSCQHVFLCIGDGDAGASFELLVMDHALRIQTFSAKESRWRAVRQASLASHDPNLANRLCTSRPAVIGRTVYWSCCTRALFWDAILALDVDTGKATLTELPLEGRFIRVFPGKNDKRLLLASVRGRLNLLISQLTGITMWVLTAAASPETWSRWLVISEQEILRQAGELMGAPFNLEEFGERSGSVIFHKNRGELFRLDLGIKGKKPVVTRIKSPGSASVTRLFLHETDLIALLQAMKSF